MGYYRRFGDSFVSIASPLTTLTQKSKKLDWSEAYEKSFQILKYRLTSALVLTLPEDTKDFVVYCDAFRVTSWGVFSCNMGRLAYASRKLKVHERNYSTHDLELARWYLL